MTFEEYQKQALTTDHSVGKNTNDPDFFAIVLGLAGEAGEVSEKFKKIYWHKKGVWDEEDKKMIAKELGDILWYLSSLSSHVGIPLDEIAKGNIEKLRSRVERGTHLGWGDNR
jgi:NTP pyrophosphatase (non-canonical NTP hydrolase)